MSSKSAEMKKEITGVLADVNKVEPTSECKKMKELNKLRTAIFSTVADHKTEKKAQASKSVINFIRNNPGKLTAALGGLGLTGAGTYGMMSPDDNPKVRNWQVWKTKLAIKAMATKLKHGWHDVEMESGLHRVKVPKWAITEDALPSAGFKGGLIAIPERGQEQLKNYRYDDPDVPFHIHKHPKSWFMHKDKHPSMILAVEDAVKSEGGVWDRLKNTLKALGKGTKHVIFEGIPGGIDYLKRVIKGAPTFEELVNKVTTTKEASSPVIPMHVKDNEFTVEVADTTLEEIRGLSGRDYLPDDHGMLFKRADGFWMRGVNFDLDIVFTDKAGTIKDIQTMTKLGEYDYPVIYTPEDKSATIAIELPAHWCERKGVEVGDTVYAGGLDGS